MLPQGLDQLLASGVSLVLGTRDARLVPEPTRALGARVEPGGAELTVFVPEAVGARTFANLRDNGRVALTISRIADHYTTQLKGTLLELRPAEPAEREVVDRYRASLAQALAFVGLPAAVTLRLGHWPCQAIRFRVQASFEQTPGPRAGEPLAGGAPR